MSEMLVRAVKAAHRAGDEYLETIPARLDARPSAWRRELDFARHRAALLAALDPEDEALVEAMAEAIAAYGTSHFGDDRPLEQQDKLVQVMRRGEARDAIRALKRIAQGER